MAADAAGTQLGEVFDMQVSTMPVVCPMIEAAPQPRVGVGSGSSSGGTDPGATGQTRPGDRYRGREPRIPTIGCVWVSRAGRREASKTIRTTERNAVVAGSTVTHGLGRWEPMNQRPARWRRDLRSEGLKNQFHIVGDARECRTNRSVLLETK